MKIILTESQYKKFFNEQMEVSEPSPQNCSLKVKKFIDAIMGGLTEDEIDSLAYAYRKLGKEGMENKVEEVLEDENISENKDQSSLKSAIHKIAMKHAIAGTKVLGLTSAVMICLGLISNDSLDPRLESGLETFSVITIIVSVISTIVAIKTKSKK